MTKKNNASDYDRFNEAMDKLLKADPRAVREAMEREKHEREEEATRIGKRGRGRPPKSESARGAR